MIDSATAEAWLHEREADCPPKDRETIADPTVLLRTGPAPYPWASAVLRVNWPDEEVERRIVETRSFFEARGRRFVWLIGPSSRPRDLAARLPRHGFGRDVEEDERILVARLPVRGLRPNPDVRIVEVTDEGPLRDSVRVMGSRWYEAILADRRRYLACPERRGGFVVAYLEEEAAGAAGWTDTSDGRAVLLNGGIVREPFRRRGIYSALVAWRLARAVERGRGFAALIANPRTSGPILLKRGFVDLGPMPIFYSPAPVASGTGHAPRDARRSGRPRHRPRDGAP